MAAHGATEGLKRTLHFLLYLRFFAPLNAATSCFEATVYGSNLADGDKALLGGLA
jgi:hypothetical protein